MEPELGEITLLLQQIRNGDRGAESRLIPLLYHELRRLASRYVRHERSGHSLQTTALVDEAYLRLTRQRGAPWQNRAHFFGVAASLMRHILVDHARERLAKKRGGSGEKLGLDEARAVAVVPSDQLLALDEALKQLEERDPRLSRIVELRFFGGLSEEETGEVLGISVRTVKRDWSIAKAWLYRQIK